MKHLIFAGIMAVLSFLVLAAGMMASGRCVRKNELQRVLDRAVEQAVEGLLEEKGSEGMTENFLETFIRQMMQGIESDSEITVQVMGADMEKGLLSVRVEEQFFHPGGVKAAVAADKTVVLEQYSLPEKRLCTISYKIGTKVYKCYCLAQGSSIQVPGVPEEDFLYWTNTAGERQRAGEKTEVRQDQVWEAVMK